MHARAWLVGMPPAVNACAPPPWPVRLPALPCRPAPQACADAAQAYGAGAAQPVTGAMAACVLAVFSQPQSVRKVCLSAYCVLEKNELDRCGTRRCAGQVAGMMIWVLLPTP